MLSMVQENPLEEEKKDVEMQSVQQQSEDHLAPLEEHASIQSASSNLANNTHTQAVNQTAAHPSSSSAGGLFGSISKLFTFGGSKKASV